MLVNGETYPEIAKKYNKSKTFMYELVRVYKQVFGITGVISKYDYLKIIGETEKIVDKYIKGCSMDEIGKEYNVSERTVASWLLKEKIKIRDTGKISKVNQDIFDVIDSEIKAYTIGLITADGSVSKKSNSVTICLTKDDGYLLEIINEKLLDGLGIMFLSHKEDKKPRMVLNFSGGKIKNRLADFNIVPNKTYSLKELSSLIPKEYYHHYIRGLFDGDGVCSYYKSHEKIRKVRIGYCSHEKEFVADFQSFLCEKLNLSKNKLFNTGGCWQCSWGSNHDIKAFFDYIYKDATIFLGRKHKKLFDYVNTEVN